MLQLFWVLILATAAFVSGNPAWADNADLLRGKTIRVIIGGTANGSTDSFARTFLDALGKALPDSQIVAQNVPTANGAVAMHDALNAGSSAINLVAVATGPLYMQVTDPSFKEVDVGAFQWIGALTQDERVAVVPKSLGKFTIEELRKMDRQIVAPAEAAGAPQYVEALALSVLTGLNIQVVAGVKTEERLALLLSGNADFLISSYIHVRSLIESGDLVPVFQISKGRLSQLFPNLPTLADIVTPDASKDVVNFIESMNVLGRMIAAAPGTDPAVVLALRETFDEVVADPETAKIFESKKLYLAPTSGSEVQSRIQAIVGSDRTRSLLKSYVDCGEKISTGETKSCNR
jgi:tripartite-type tricarboxylate transporter receptor subunit TctC